jgi:hypothetical protein
MYSPKENDYVVWEQQNIEGWVYHVGTEYITIEVSTTPMPDPSIHQKYHVLVLCYRNQIDQLVKTKSRKSKHEDHERA